MMNALCLHTGATTVSRDELIAVATPPRTATWVPIPHDRLLSGVQNSLERSGLTIVAEQHGMTHDGARYFGLLEVRNGHNAEDFGLMVGLRNSHDKRFPAGLAVGARVFVCDNLSFSSEIVLSRKHTVNVVRDLPQLIGRAVGQLGTHRQTQETRFLSYKDTNLTDGQAHDIIIQALDARVIPVTKLPDVLTEWREPGHEEFATGRTAWRLFNSFTEILKGSIDVLPKRTQALHGILDVACGMAT